MALLAPRGFSTPSLLAQGGQRRFPLLNIERDIPPAKGIPLFTADIPRLKAFEKAWLEVLAEESAKDPLFKQIADHYLNFRKQYAIWGESQLMKATYQKE